ncbi:hypothetical protein HA39_03210 [Pantoea brenneri]|nr:hypothetical protein HA39_03210 [Pantoea brenneri]
MPTEIMETLVRVSDMSMEIQETLKQGRTVQLKSALIDESSVYKMLLRKGATGLAMSFSLWLNR